MFFTLLCISDLEVGYKYLALTNFPARFKLNIVNMRAYVCSSTNCFLLI